MASIFHDINKNISITIDIPQISALYILPNSILYFRIPHNTLCLPPKILHKPLFLNAPGSITFSQEHFKIISYAKFGGQTECIMGNSKIVNELRAFAHEHVIPTVTPAAHPPSPWANE